MSATKPVSRVYNGFETKNTFTKIKRATLTQTVVRRYFREGDLDAKPPWRRLCDGCLLKEVALIGSGLCTGCLKDNEKAKAQDARNF
jgi:hypothetical protein